MSSIFSFLAAVGVAALVAASFGPDAWYEGLAKPVFQPPNWLFAPVWTLLYISIAVAAWRVWETDKRGRRGAIGLWFAQLIVNAAWSPLFFGAHWTAIALANLVVLGVLVVATLAVFGRFDRLAAWLFAPYLAWLGFAGLLNASILVLNGPA